jgi:hypothetical protein
MLDRETLVALATKPLHFLRPIDRNPLARRLAEPAVQKPGLALLTSHAASSGGTSARSPRATLLRLFLIELRRFPPVKKSQKHRHAHSLFGFPPAHPDLPKGLGLPDRSCATEIGHIVCYRQPRSRVSCVWTFRPGTNGGKRRVPRDRAGGELIQSLMY